jgi:PAS domain-containing protein
MALPDSPAPIQGFLAGTAGATGHTGRRRLLRDLLLGGLLAVTYWAAVIVGLHWAVLPGVGTPVWPAAGIAFAGLVLGGSRLWPAILIGRVAAAITLETPLPFWADILVGVATTLGAYLPTRALERTQRRLALGLGNMRDMAWLTLGGALAGAVVSAGLGVGAIWLGGTPPETLPYAGLNWWFGYLVGALTVAPLILSWSAPGRSDSPHCNGATSPSASRSWRWSQAWSSCRRKAPPSNLAHAAAAGLGGAGLQRPGLSVALAITSGFAIAGAVNGTGPLASEADSELVRVLLTQQFIAMTGLTLLFLAAVADERRDVEALGQLAAIVSSSPEAMVSLDREGRVLSWNRGAERLLGWPEAEALGRPLSEVLRFCRSGRPGRRTGAARAQPPRGDPVPGAGRHAHRRASHAGARPRT